jgi:hypothetical protein
LRGRLQLVHAGSLAEPAVGLPDTATVAELELLPRSTAGSPPAVVLYGQDGRPVAVVDAGVAATVPPDAVASTPLSAVSYALGAGAYVPESSQGQELLQYLAQLDGQAYAVVSRDGTITGLLRQATVLEALTAKSPRGSRRIYDRNG